MERTFGFSLFYTLLKHSNEITRQIYKEIYNMIEDKFFSDNYGLNDNDNSINNSVVEVSLDNDASISLFKDYITEDLVGVESIVVNGLIDLKYQNTIAVLTPTDKDDVFSTEGARIKSDDDKSFIFKIFDAIVQGFAYLVTVISNLGKRIRNYVRETAFGVHGKFYAKNKQIYPALVNAYGSKKLSLYKPVNTFEKIVGDMSEDINKGISGLSMLIVLLDKYEDMIDNIAQGKYTGAYKLFYIAKSKMVAPAVAFASFLNKHNKPLSFRSKEVDKLISRDKLPPTKNVVNMLVYGNVDYNGEMMTISSFFKKAKFETLSQASSIEVKETLNNVDKSSKELLKLTKTLKKVQSRARSLMNDLTNDGDKRNAVVDLLKDITDLSTYIKVIHAYFVGVNLNIFNEYINHRLEIIKVVSLMKGYKKQNGGK